ncbi:hypothetical protein [Actinokineospora sp. NBRC 105648]|uniref:hypothetical protein n=1 Tax=Actinokineospora sp. NBRC 105648 TaxID=3032206 RepID=UPI0024A383D2|nr:hypothetical protein [Actinokineospora sp. NBRC 105648]GLZ43072.1 hypothetical protein Acsp05_66960 [Actinokineospora sp. NBRC 105648]
MSTPRMFRRCLLAALVLVGLAAPTADAAPSAVPTYRCKVGQVSSTIFAGQFCTRSNGAPSSGLIATAFYAVVDVLNGPAGVAACQPLLGLVPLAGVVTNSDSSPYVQVIGLDCRLG